MRGALGRRRNDSSSSRGSSSSAPPSLQPHTLPRVVPPAPAPPHPPPHQTLLMIFTFTTLSTLALLQNEASMVTALFYNNFQSGQLSNNVNWLWAPMLALLLLLAPLAPHIVSSTRVHNAALHSLLLLACLFRLILPHLVDEQGEAARIQVGAVGYTLSICFLALFFIRPGRDSRNEFGIGIHSMSMNNNNNTDMTCIMLVGIILALQVSQLFRGIGSSFDASIDSAAVGFGLSVSISWLLFFPMIVFLAWKVWRSDDSFGLAGHDGSTSLPVVEQQQQQLDEEKEEKEDQEVGQDFIQLHQVKVSKFKGNVQEDAPASEHRTQRVSISVPDACIRPMTHRFRCMCKCCSCCKCCDGAMPVAFLSIALAAIFFLFNIGPISPTILSRFADVCCRDGDGSAGSFETTAVLWSAILAVSVIAATMVLQKGRTWILRHEVSRKLFYSCAMIYSTCLYLLLRLQRPAGGGSVTDVSGQPGWQDEQVPHLRALATLVVLSSPVLFASCGLIVSALLQLGAKVSPSSFLVGFGIGFGVCSVLFKFMAVFSFLFSWVPGGIIWRNRYSELALLLCLVGHGAAVSLIRHSAQESIKKPKQLISGTLSFDIPSVRLGVGALSLVLAIGTWIAIITTVPSNVKVSPPSDQLRVLTYNIHLGLDRTGTPRMLEQIDEVGDLDWHITCLLESETAAFHAGQHDVVRHFARYTGARYFSHGGRYIPGQWSPSIVSRIPITDTQTYYFRTSQKAQNAVVYAKLQWPNDHQTDQQGIDFFCVHLSVSNEEEVNEVGQLLNLTSIAELFPTASSSNPQAVGPRVVLAGDFNFNEEAPQYNLLGHTGLQETWKQLHPTDNITLPGFHGQSNQEFEKRIDMVFVGTQLNTTRYEVVRSQECSVCFGRRFSPECLTCSASDHLAVLVDLERT